MKNISKIFPTSKKTLSIHFITIVSTKEFNKAPELQNLLLTQITNTLFCRIYGPSLAMYFGYV